VRYEYPSNKNDACPNKLDNDDRPTAAEDDDDDDVDNRTKPGNRLNSRTMIGCMLNGIGVFPEAEEAEAEEAEEAEDEADSDETARALGTPPPRFRANTAKSLARRTASPVTPVAVVVPA
jgi:hypothetical protein